MAEGMCGGLPSVLRSSRVMHGWNTWNTVLSQEIHGAIGSIFCVSALGEAGGGMLITRALDLPLRCRKPPLALAAIVTAWPTTRPARNKTRADDAEVGDGH